MDLMEGLARPLPLTVICELLGSPEEDRATFRNWVQALMSVTARGAYDLKVTSR